MSVLWLLPKSQFYMFLEKDLVMFLDSRCFEIKFLVVMCPERGFEWCFYGSMGLLQITSSGGRKSWGLVIL